MGLFDKLKRGLQKTKELLNTDIRDLLKSSEPEIRLAAIDALGACGRRETDLQALEAHLFPRSEADLAVRQKTWDAFLAIAQRLPVRDRVRVSDGFDRANDDVSQRLRLELLKASRSDSAASRRRAR